MSVCVHVTHCTFQQHRLAKQTVNVVSSVAWDILSADTKVLHQQTTSQTTATQKAEHISKGELQQTIQNLMHKSSAEAKQYAAIYMRQFNESQVYCKTEYSA